jgi:hypothetical protein
VFSLSRYNNKVLGYTRWLLLVYIWTKAATKPRSSKEKIPEVLSAITPLETGQY